MKRAAFAWVAIATLGCARAAIPKSTAAAHGTGTRAPSWPEYASELVGVRAAFPASPNELAHVDASSGSEVHVEGLYLDHEGISYVCARAWVPGRDRLADDQQLVRAASALARPGAETKSVIVGAFRGIELEGTTKSGRAVIARAFAVGDGTVYGSATALENAPPLDRARAERFVRSCVFEMPWRIHASVEGAFTVTVPAAAILVPPSAMGLDEHTVGNAFVIGGIHEITYLATSTVIDSEVREEFDDDGLLDATIAEMRTETSQGHWSDALEMDGASARDLGWLDGGVHYRWRLIVTDTHLIQLGITSKSKEVTRGADAQRFLDSLRRGADD